jgi:hypothetical protein
MITKEKFIEMLKGHDWYYMYSDDNRYYTKGRDESAAIMAAMKGNKELGKIYEDYLIEKNLK